MYVWLRSTPNPIAFVLVCCGKWYGFEGLSAPSHRDNAENARSDGTDEERKLDGASGENSEMWSEVEISLVSEAPRTSE
jgi:hypothetical protein